MSYILSEIYDLMCGGCTLNDTNNTKTIKKFLAFIGNNVPRVPANFPFGLFKSINLLPFRPV